MRRSFRLLGEIIAALMAIELGIMVLLPLIAPHVGAVAENMIDATLLALIASPFIYWRSASAMRSVMRPQSPAQRSAHLSRNRAIALTLGVQLLGLSLTGLTLFWNMQDDEAALEKISQWRVERLQIEIERRINQSLYGLRGLRASYNSHQDISHAEFRAWVEARDLPKEFPGIRGFGFMERVERANLDAWVARARKDGVPDFTVRTQGEAPDLYVVRHIEPYASNRAALGFDIGSEAKRRQAAERAVKTAEPTLTARIELVQDAQKTPGFLYMLPVFHTGAPLETEAQRQRALHGIVFVPMVAAELLHEASQVVDGMLDFSVYDGPPEEANLVYASAGVPSATPAPLFATRVLSLGGREITVQFQRSARGLDYKEFDSSLVFVALSGALASMLLAGGTWMLSVSRLRATRLALAMTRDIARFARVARHTQNAVAMLDKEGSIDWVNEGFERLTGHGSESLQGRAFTRWAGISSSAPGALELLQESVHQRKPCRVELQYTDSHGEPHQIDTELTPYFDEAGTIEGFISVGADVSHLKRIQQRLEEAIRNSRSLLNTVETHAIVSFADRQGNITQVNDQFCSVSGYNREELVGKSHSVVSSGEHPDAFWAEMWQTISSGSPWRGEICNRRKDGSLYWVDSMIAPFWGDDGLVEKYVSIRTEITQRKANEAALAQATQRLELAIEGGIDGLWDWMDIGQDAQWWSPNYYHMLGYTPQELPASASAYRALLHPESVEPSRQLLAQALAGEAEFNLEVQLKTRDQGYRWFSTRAKVYRDAAGKPHRMAGATQDITERRRAQDALQQAMREAQSATVAKGQFLANMSHELRTPMNAILGMLTLLDSTDLSEQQEDYLHKSRSAAQSLLSILNDILDLSKVEAGKMELDPQPTRMEQLLRDLSVILSAYGGKKRLEILFDLDPALPETVMVDANRLKQVLINLAGNAVKFTEKGEVVVKLQVLQRTAASVQVAFSVSDTGIGISEEQQKKLFHAFSQAEASTTRRFGGTGLGLAISRQLVQLMGGDIAMHSEAGQGSTFSFVLELPTRSTPSQVADATPPPRLQVLLVEDNAVARALTQAMCEANDWDCTAVDSGEAALALWESTAERPAPHFDVVLLDCNMPGMDGWQTASRLRARDASRGQSPTPIVMVTANSRQTLEDRPQHEQDLVNGYLVKPVTMGLLRDAVLHRQEGMHKLRKHQRSANTRPLEGLHLLVVEDNLINQQVAEELLSAKGARVSLAANGKLGVEAIAAATPQFDLVLMDMQMPVMDGYAATAYVRNTLQLHQLPIVAMTANAMSTDRAECMAAGMNEHVGKPFDLARLVDLILRLTGHAAEGLANTAPAQESQQAQADAASSSTADIDIATALQRMAGMQATFVRNAQVFEAQLATQGSTLRALLQQADHGTVRRELHTLKGTAGLMGCNALAREAARLEALAAAQRWSDITDQLPALEALLHTTGVNFSQAIAALQARGEAAAPATAPDKAAAREALARLLPLLAAEDFGVLETFAELREALAGLPEADKASLEDALQALDFAQAHAVATAALQAFSDA